MRPLRTRLVLGLLLTTALLLAGCTDGGDEGKRTADEPPGVPDPNIDNNTTMETVDVAVSLSGAYPATIAYEPATITVPANSTVNLTFTNDDQAPIFNHDWVLEDYEDTAATEVIPNGESSAISFAAPPVGTYTFYCSVPGHRDNGMEGTFTVA